MNAAKYELKYCSDEFEVIRNVFDKLTFCFNLILTSRFDLPANHVAFS